MSSESGDGLIVVAEVPEKEKKGDARPIRK
jgi:hypothetical protein